MFLTYLVDIMAIYVSRLCAMVFRCHVFKRRSAENTRSDDAFENGWHRHKEMRCITSEKRLCITRSFWPSKCAIFRTERSEKFSASKKSFSWLSWTPSFSRSNEAGNWRLSRPKCCDRLIAASRITSSLWTTILSRESKIVRSTHWA